MRIVTLLDGERSNAIRIKTKTTTTQTYKDFLHTTGKLWRLDHSGAYIR